MNIYLAEQRRGSLPSRASFNGVTNRWNSISSMAESTSLAFSVLRFPFIAKLLALKKKKKKIQKGFRGRQTPSCRLWGGWKRGTRGGTEKPRSQMQGFFCDVVKSLPSPYKRVKAKQFCCFSLLQTLQQLDEG